MTKKNKKTEQKVTDKPKQRRLNYAVVKKAIDGSYGNITFIANRLKVERKTVYEWLDKSESLKELYNSEREKIVDFAETRLMQSMQGGSDTMIAFVLRTLGKDRGYVEKQQIEHSGGLEQRIKNMTQDEREQRLKKLLAEARKELDL